MFWSITNKGILAGLLYNLFFNLIGKLQSHNILVAIHLIHPHLQVTYWLKKKKKFHTLTLETYLLYSPYLLIHLLPFLHEIHSHIIGYKDRAPVDLYIKNWPGTSRATKASYPLKFSKVSPQHNLFSFTMHADANPLYSV